MITLLADIGGTNSRLALAACGRLHRTSIRSLRNADMPGLLPMLAAFLEESRTRPRAVILAAAGPVAGDRVQLTNRPGWSCTTAEITALTGAAHVALLNDLQAMGHALAVPEIAGAPLTATRLVLAIGTGMNAAVAHPRGGAAFVPPGESGYQSLPFTTEADAPILAALARDFGANTAEALLSGPGIARAHRLLAGETLAPSAILADAPATRGLVLRVLGGYLGSLALAHLPHGGIYLAGAVGRALYPLLAEPDFAGHFAARGAYSELVRQFPLRCIFDDLAPLHGLAALTAAP